MKFFYLKSAIAATLICGTGLNAQNNSKLKEIAADYTYNNQQQINFIKLKQDYIIHESSVETFLNSVVLNNSDVTVKKIKSSPDHLGYLHTKYQLYYNNTPVDNAIIIVHSQNGNVISVNGDLNAIQKPANKVGINEQAALQAALAKVNAKVYKWQNKAEEQHMKQALNKPDFSYFPKGDLILYTKQNGAQKPSVNYAYKFNVYAEEPLYRANVIVDAQSGAILEEQNLICTADVTSTVVTKYSGTQTVTVDNNAVNSYRMRETARGLGIETYNMNNTTTYSATDFTNSTTNWSAVNIDQAARDAHWGAEKTYDYYLADHGINSIDNAGYKLLSYVHYSTNYNNAFWDGTKMTYGDGNGTTFTILTALDVCGHEITHGLVSNTANLGTGEAGALNEGFADIFGTTIEHFARPTQWDWKIGADITPGGNGIRNMSNPNLISQPDTYMGTYWDPAGEVHKNNGPCIYWYYLLNNGGTGTNDNNNAYNVSGLGWTTAANIAYRALTVYFTPTTTYATARNYAIQAAKDLYGSCSNEVIQTTNAWYAVGVGPAYTSTVASNFTANATSFCTVPATVNFNNTTVNGSSYLWNFGDGGVATSTNPVYTYTAAGTYTVKLKANGCLTAVDSITKPAYITINIPTNPVTTGASRCGTGTVSLNATGGSQLYWYAAPTASGTPLTVGNNYVTPSISSNSTYYVVNTVTNAPVSGAPTSTSIGTGGTYTNTGQYDTFDVIQACTLKSVVVYAGVAGNRTIELRNSANTLLTSTVVNIPSGTSTVSINFALTPGTGYRIGVAAASTISLYRNTAGAVFPYNIGGLVSVTGTSAGGGYWYFFYNWQVQKNSCTSAPIAVTATVTTPPVLTVNNPTTCAGQNITLTGSTANSYTWSTGANTATINVNPTSTTVYTLTASNGPGCNSSITSTVTVGPSPVLTVNSATICNGQNANLTASGAATYTWSSGQTTGNISVNPTSNTSYTVHGANGSCSVASVANVIVNPLPSVSITSTETMACTNDGQFALTGSPSGGTYSGAGVTGNSFNPAVGAGNYYAVYSYTNNNGCASSDSVNIMVSVCTGLKSNVNAASVSIYPNPASDHFVVNSGITGLTISITDALGKVLMQKELAPVSEDINIARFANGVYFIEVKNASHAVYHTKIVKE